MPRGSYGALFWTRINRYPPVLLRLLARVPKGRPLTTAELARRSGLGPATVDAVSRQTDWTGIDLPTARAFMLACDADLTNRSHCRRIHMYLKAQPRSAGKRFSYLRRSVEWNTLYLPLLEIYANHLTNHSHGYRRENSKPAQSGRESPDAGRASAPAAPEESGGRSVVGSAPPEV